MGGQDGFGVELYGSQGQTFVSEGHQLLVVIKRGGDQILRQWGLNHPGMVASHLKTLR